MPLLFLRSAASLFRRGTPQKNTTPSRPGRGSVFITLRGPAPRTRGSPPQIGVGAATPCFTLQRVPIGRGTPKKQPPTVQAGGQSLSHFAGALLARGDLSHKRRGGSDSMFQRSSLSPLGGERQRTTPSRPGRGSIFITLRKRTPRTRGSLPQKAWGRCPASGSSPPPPP